MLSFFILQSSVGSLMAPSLFGLCSWSGPFLTEGFGVDFVDVVFMMKTTQYMVEPRGFCGFHHKNHKF